MEKLLFNAGFRVSGNMNSEGKKKKSHKIHKERRYHKQVGGEQQPAESDV